MKKKKERPFLGIHFDCCNVYSRIYLNQSGTAFIGWCPKCCGKAVVKVSPIGSKSRFFSAR